MRLLDHGRFSIAEASIEGNHPWEKSTPLYTFELYYFKIES